MSEGPLSPAEKQRRYRERLRAAETPIPVTRDPDSVTEEPVTEPSVTEEPVTEARKTTEQQIPVFKLIALARAGRLVLSETQEQQIRDHFGFGSSETRTLAERDATAARIVGRTVSMSEEEYVRQALSHPNLLNRTRAERYARWRYREFHKGEVASL